MSCRYCRAVVVAMLCVIACPRSSALRADDYVPRLGEFPPADAGQYFVGELVDVDHVNRRGALRLMGDNTSDRYHRAPSHRFAMLPYGEVWYHGAPAELKDIPLGTVLHGSFTLPPEGDESIPPVDKGSQKYVPPYNHALCLEDDFSFRTRRGQTWKLTSIELNYDSTSAHYPPTHPSGDWKKTPILGGRLKATLLGDGEQGGIQGEQEFTIDRSTRLWRGRQLIAWEDLAANEAWNRQESSILLPENLLGQISLAWAPDWQNKQFHVADIWLDEESQAVAKETQRQVHIRHIRHRWLPGWIDQVEHQPGGGGKVTITLFSGQDASLYQSVRDQAKNGGVAIAAGEPTLRTWWQEHDNKGGRIVAMEEAADPPQGSSGIQIQVQLSELLEGFRPGRIVRVRPNGFPNVKLPPEERVQGMTQRIPPPYTP